MEVELPLVSKASEIDAYAENGVLEVEVAGTYRWPLALAYFFVGVAWRASIACGQNNPPLDAAS